MNKQTLPLHFDLSEYFTLQPKCCDRSRKSIRIMQNSELRVSVAFMKEFDFSTPLYVTVLLHNSENNLAFIISTESTDGSSYLKKNGCFSLENAADFLKSRNLRVPACFVVNDHPTENIWLASYDDEYRFPDIKPSRQKLVRQRARIPKEVFS